MGIDTQAQHIYHILIIHCWSIIWLIFLNN